MTKPLELEKAARECTRLVDASRLSTDEAARRLAVAWHQFRQQQQAEPADADEQLGREVAPVMAELEAFRKMQKDACEALGDLLEALEAPPASEAAAEALGRLEAALQEEDRHNSATIAPRRSRPPFSP